MYVKFLINYSSLRCQPFYNREGRGLGFSCSIEVVFHVSKKTFCFTHQVDQFFFGYIHQAKTIFQRFFFYKMQSDIYQMTPCRTQTLQKEMRSLHTLIRTTRTFIYPQYRVLLGNIFSKLNELFCNYKF